MEGGGCKHSLKTSSPRTISWWTNQALFEHELIAPIPHGQTSEGVWNLGYAFLENVHYGDPYREVPSCDINGQPIGSEIGSFQRWWIDRVQLCSGVEIYSVSPNVNGFQKRLRYSGVIRLDKNRGDKHVTLDVNDSSWSLQKSILWLGHTPEPTLKSFHISCSTTLSRTLAQYSGSYQACLFNSLRGQHQQNRRKSRFFESIILWRRQRSKPSFILAIDLTLSLERVHST
jgi:hypothetical protein